MEAYEKSSGLKLQINFANSFDYKIDTDVYREILFSNVEGSSINVVVFNNRWYQHSNLYQEKEEIKHALDLKHL